jgi:hypothetical protein
VGITASALAVVLLLLWVFWPRGGGEEGSVPSHDTEGVVTATIEDEPRPAEARSRPGPPSRKSPDASEARRPGERSAAEGRASEEGPEGGAPPTVVGQSATVRYLFRHRQQSGTLRISVGSQILVDERLTGGTTFRKAQVVQGSFTLPPGAHTIEARLHLEGKEPVGLLATEEVACGTGQTHYLFVDYAKFMGTKRLNLYWDDDRARREVTR